MTSRDGDPFLAAARGRRSGRTPVWFMRQAGRSLPEYRAIRGDGSMGGYKWGLERKRALIDHERATRAADRR